jgi:SEC-C motif-containing protein
VSLPDADPPCPCGAADRPGRYRRLSACCGRYLAGTPAPDAHWLMRSRYTAYVLGDTDHLLATWHPDTRPQQLQPDPQVRWLGLQVRDHRQLDADHAEVEFVARYREHGRGARLHERSRFERLGGRWFYRDGDML